VRTKPTSNPRVYMILGDGKIDMLRKRLAVQLIRFAYWVGGIVVTPVPTRQDKRRMMRGSSVISGGYD
jgi:hypothetical protein